MPSRIRVYIATSIDGFIAGLHDELDWLPTPSGETPVPEGAVDFPTFLQDVGALLMGRRTYEVVRGLSPTWPYADLPVLVATHQPFDADLPKVRPVQGDIHALLDQALVAADGKDVYLDGGQMIRAALEAGRVDELIVTWAPVALGQGLPLFAGLQRRIALELVRHVDFAGGMVQVTMRPHEFGSWPKRKV
jgi:dihydrofolate reductase